MKKFLALCFLMVSLSLLGGEPHWQTDLEAAKELAKKENKTILINFTGSDWCGWCKKLDREVFQKQTFVDFAEKELILVQVDFPRYKKIDQTQMATNRKLMSKYNVPGFPSIILVNADEKVLLRTGYQPGGPDSYIDHLQPHVDKAN